MEHAIDWFKGSQALYAATGCCYPWFPYHMAHGPITASIDLLVHGRRHAVSHNISQCNNYKHNGAVLPVVTAPVGRGVDGVDAMA
jgi:hypothetical protein